MTIGSLADWAARQNISRVAAYKRIASHNIPWVSKGKLDLDDADRIWNDSVNLAKQRGGEAGGLAASDAAQARLFANGEDEDDAPELPFPSNGSSAGNSELRSNLAKLQMQREVYRIRREKLTVEQMEGKLVPLADVRAFEAEMITAVKAHLVLIGSELADDLAATADPVKCRFLVEDRINAALVQLSEWKPSEK